MRILSWWRSRQRTELYVPMTPKAMLLEAQQQVRQVWPELWYGGEKMQPAVDLMVQKRYDLIERVEAARVRNSALFG